MDPISQAAAGALAAHLVAGKSLPRASLAIGALAGMAPDLDIFIPTFGDPTAGWFWHRGPSHALVAVPVLGVLLALPLLAFASLRRRWGWLVAATTAAVATHGPLDALTSYGTMLYWPLSDRRVSTDTMPIVDPVFTLIVVGLLVTSFATKSRTWTWAAAGFAAIYMMFGVFQHTRATDAVRQLADARGHSPTHMRAMPSLGALTVWRGVYTHDGRLHADGVYVPYVGGTRVRVGTSRPLSAPIGEPGTEARRHFERFRWFTDNRVYPLRDDQPLVVGDGRYSADPAGFVPLWGLDFTGSDVRRTSGRDAVQPGELVRNLLRTTFGFDGRYVPLKAALQEE